MNASTWARQRQRIRARLRQKLPRLASAARRFRPGYNKDRRQFDNLDSTEVFRTIYRDNLWQSDETRSGAGSTLAATERIRSALPDLLERLGAKVVLDVGCGDFHWMQHVDLSRLDLYIGADIVPDIIEKLQQEYGGPNREFRCLHLCTDTLPAADLILCRDVFLHLKNDLILDAIQNIAKSEARYLLVSNYPDITFNADIVTGLSRPVNLALPPFTLPPPDQTLEDPGVHLDHRVLALWDLNRLRTRETD